jgi:hypothetical protein
MIDLDGRKKTFKGSEASGLEKARYGMASGAGAADA